MKTTEAQCPRRPPRPTARAVVLLLAALAALLATACGSSGVRGEAPFAQITAWSLDEAQIAAELRLRNVNSEPLELQALNLGVELDGTPLLDYRESRSLSIPANGTETISLRMPAQATGVALLQRLETGELGSLPYRMSGSVSSEEDGELAFQREGRIYRVPGRSGQFR